MTTIFCQDCEVFFININLAIAKNIKSIREHKKLTLDTAASLTGVSRSMLAQIERGDANPTITVLWKIANGYKVPFTSLTEQDDSPATIVRLDNENCIIEGGGKYLNYPVFAFNEQRSFETYRIKILEGGKLQASPHILGTEEYITVFKGCVEIKVAEELFLLQEGDSIRFKADVTHSYASVGEDEAVLSMILYYTNSKN